MGDATRKAAGVFSRPRTKSKRPSNANGFGLACFVTRRERRKEGVEAMPRGEKSKYTDKQKRQAEHIEEGYEKRGNNPREAKRRAWATVNAMTGGGKKSGSGRGKKLNSAPAKKGGALGGAASAARPKAARSAAATKAARTRKRHVKQGQESF
jgi:hypothetical protein